MMFPITLRILTTSAVLLHAWFGCCYHHAHQCETYASVFQKEAGTPSSAGCSHAAGCSSHTDDHASHGRSHAGTTTGGSSPGESDEDDHNHLPCGEGQCTYINSVPVELTTRVLTSSFHIVPDVDSLNSTVAANWFERTRDPAGNSMSSCVRACLQVWLL